MPDNYTREFHHTDWVDNVDLVSAQDPDKGLNKRFKSLEMEFDKIASVIEQINSSLPSPNTTLTFAPNFSRSGVNETPWEISRGVASIGTGNTGAEGWISVQLPEGSRIERMTVIGNKVGNVVSFRVRLIRQDFNGDEIPLVNMSLSNLSDGAFQQTLSLDTVDNIVANQSSKYIVSARLNGAEAGSTVLITAIQIVFSQV